MQLRGSAVCADVGVCQDGATPACTTCKAGWQGANCDACTASSACQAQLGSPQATCNTQFAYTRCDADPCSAALPAPWEPPGGFEVPSQAACNTQVAPMPL